MENQNFNGENKKRFQEKIYLVIIIILIASFAAFIIYKKDVLFNKERVEINENQTQIEQDEKNNEEINKDNNTDVNNEKNEINIQVSEEKVKIAYYLLVPEGAQYSDLNDRDLDTMAIGTINLDLYSGKKLSELTNKQKLVMALRYEDSIKNFPRCIEDSKSGTTLQMTNLGGKIFKDTSFLKEYTNKTNLDVDNYRITTDEKNITIQNINCGGIERSSKDVTKLLNYEVKGTKLVLTIGAVHLELNEVAEDGNWYDDTYNISNHNNKIQSHVTEIDFKKHSTYTAIFDLTNNGLYFESIERN